MSLLYKYTKQKNVKNPKMKSQQQGKALTIFMSNDQNPPSSILNRENRNTHVSITGKIPPLSSPAKKRHTLHHACQKAQPPSFMSPMPKKGGVPKKGTPSIIHVTLPS